MRKLSLLLALVLVPMPGIGPAAATACEPDDTEDPVLQGFFVPSNPVELSTTFAQRAAWQPTFLVNATVSDDREVVMVWAEFIELDTGWTFTLVLGNKTLLPPAADGDEQSEWSAQVPKARVDIVEGAYSVIVRVHDACNNTFVSPDDLYEFEVEAGDGEFPDPVFPAQQGLVAGVTLSGYDAQTDFCTPVNGEEPVFRLGPGGFLQANVTMGRLREVTYNITYGPGDFTDPETLAFPYVVGQDILREGLQTVTFTAHGRLIGELEKTLTVCNVLVDTQPPEVGDVTFESDDGTVYGGLPFDIIVPASDLSPHTIRMRIQGHTVGSQVGTFDGDVGLPLQPLPAAIRYLDADLSETLTEDDVFVLDTGAMDRRLTPGDVALSSPFGGRILVVEDFLDEDGNDTFERDPLTQPPQPVAIRYMDMDGNGYDAGDRVVLDDTAGIDAGVGELSYLDVWFSGDRFGQWASATDVAREVRPLLDGAPSSFGLLDNDGDGIPSPGDAVYLTSGDVVGAGDVRIVPGFEGLDVVGRSDDFVYDPFSEEYVFPDKIMPGPGTYVVTIEVRDSLGNLATHSIDLLVEPGYTKYRVTDLRVENATPLPGQPVHFNATVNQTDGVGELRATAAFSVGEQTATQQITVRLDNSTTFVHNDTFVPGCHTMDLLVSVPEGVEVRDGTQARAEVKFEVFMGRVDHDGKSYWIRANAKGFPGRAVENPTTACPSPDDGLKIFQKPLATANGTHAVWAFNVTDDLQLHWDQYERNAAGEPVTTIVATAPGPREDTPGVAVALLLAALVGLAARRRW